MVTTVADRAVWLVPYALHLVESCSILLRDAKCVNGIIHGEVTQRDTMRDTNRSVGGSSRDAEAHGVVAEHAASLKSLQQQKQTLVLLIKYGPPGANNYPLLLRTLVGRFDRGW